MPVTIRRATAADLEVIMGLIEDGRRKMIAEGNTRQWTGGHPSRETVEADIASGNSYLVVDEDGIEATFAMIKGPDPTYARIYEGQWQNDNSYYVIHRIASSPKAHGVMRAVLDFAFMHTGTLRIDTHEDNRTMRELLQKYGFSYCGIIYLENGDPRLAFQKTI